MNGIQNAKVTGKCIIFLTSLNRLSYICSPVSHFQDSTDDHLSFSSQKETSSILGLYFMTLTEYLKLNFMNLLDPNISLHLLGDR